MKVLFAGTPEVAVPSLEALLASDHEVVGVLTRADACSCSTIHGRSGGA